MAGVVELKTKMDVNIGLLKFDTSKGFFRVVLPRLYCIKNGHFRYSHAFGVREHETIP